MPHRLRKIRKKRGTRTVGYGRVGQHRKTGSKGERRAGRHKHGWTYILRYEPDYFGKKGFTSPASLRRIENIVNVGELEEIAEKIGATEKDGKVFLDLTSLGYTKLLGRGSVKKAFIIKVPSTSEVAAEKIKEAGGEVIAEIETGA